MAERPDYTAADLTPLTLREAVSREPGMYADTVQLMDEPAR